MADLLIDTTFAGKNISSAVDVYTFTPVEDGTIRIQVRLNGVVGNGDYQIYLTINDGGVQSDDVVAPVSTITVPVGTKFWLLTSTFDVITGDVIKVFIKGLGGDTNVSGSIRIFSDVLHPAVAVSNAVSGAVASGDLLIQADYTFSQAITSTLTEDLSAVTKLWFAVKAPQDPDSASIIFLEKAAGLTIVNGSTYLAPGYGTIVVTGSSGAWIITIYIDEEATSILLGLNSMYEAAVKGLLGGNTLSIWDGECQITDGLIRTYV